MAKNIMRWRHGDMNSVLLPVNGGHQIPIGDLVYVKDGLANNAVRCDVYALRSDEGFSFAGVAMQHSPVGCSEKIRVATTGVFEFPKDGRGVAIGELVGPAKIDSSIFFLADSVTAVSDPRLSCGRCEKIMENGSVLVAISGHPPTESKEKPPKEKPPKEIEPRMDLIPPENLLLLGQCLAYGEEIHEDEPWKKEAIGYHISHAMVHLTKYRAGDRSEPHLVHAVARTNFALGVAIQAGEQAEEYVRPEGDATNG